MLIHNLKLTLRNIWAKRVYASVILLSLTIGFVCSSILISFLVFETNTDTFHSKGQRIFQIFSDDPFGGQGRLSYIPGDFYDYLTTNYAEIENVCQLSNVEGITIEMKENTFPGFMVLSVDSSFFSIFDFPLVHGQKSNCLTTGSIVLSQKKAMTLFGKSDVVGNVLTINTNDTTRLLTVSAVVGTTAENSHLTFDALVHHSVLRKKGNGGASYVLLLEGNAADQLQSKINKDVQRPSLIGAGKMDYFLKPLADSYFNADNKMGFIKTRSPMFIKIGYVVCGLILFIAGFNFINLFLLFCQNRKKEIGIKKALGISPKGLFDSSLTEASVYLLIAMFLASIIAALLVPIFNSVFDARLYLEYFLSLKVVTSITIILFFSGALVVLLSVWKQWHMKPISLMSKGSSKVKFNRLLFTLQFVISITLAICSITIVHQMNYIETAPLGFNRNILQLKNPDPRYPEILPVLKQKISLLADVHDVTVCSGNPISGNRVSRYDLGNEQYYTPYLFEGDDDFLKTLDLQLIAGKMPSEMNHGKLVNQKLVQQFNLVKPVGEQVPGTKDVIAGVVKDFTCSSFKQEIPPVIISYKKTNQTLLISYEENNLAKLLPQIKAQWLAVFPDHFFRYQIIQEDLLKKYKDDTSFFRIIISFSIISMILSCFGLFALSWAVVQSRTKEMGIRKVLGASAMDILNLLTLTFTKRILVAFFMAAPIGYFLMSQWLTRFSNKIELNAWIFAISAMVVVIIASITLSLQTVRAAMTNPVDELRNE